MKKKFKTLTPQIEFFYFFIPQQRFGTVSINSQLFEKHSLYAKNLLANLVKVMEPLSILPLGTN